MPSVPPDFRAALAGGLVRWGIEHTDDQVARLWAHHAAVVEANARFNLTRITDPLEAAVKHYVDSLALLPWLRGQRRAALTVLDVGTGAGFPAVPLAEMAPDLRVTAIDATRKKTDFLADAVERLGLSRLEVLQARAEHWRVGRRFDVVAGRAVTSLAGFLSWTAHLVRAGGFIVAYKTARMGPDEQAAATRTGDGLGLHPDDAFEYDLRLGDETLPRKLVVFRRTGAPAAGL
jgi:16S rRNA (guanine527-N7)-methyltransferase